MFNRHPVNELFNKLCATKYSKVLSTQINKEKEAQSRFVSNH